MLSVGIKHPDSENFIDAKMTEGKITGANVSVKIDKTAASSRLSRLCCLVKISGRSEGDY